jgi:hypothetical protein
MSELMRELNTEMGTELPYAFLGNYLRATFSKATEVLDRARSESGADHLADRALEASEEAVGTNADVGRNRARAAAMQWMAGAWNRKRYGQGTKQDVSVTVNVASLHLDAMRARSIDAVAKRNEVLHSATPVLERGRSTAPALLADGSAVEVAVRE